MIKNRKFVTLLCLLLLCSVCLTFAAIGFTYAGYVTVADITRTIAAGTKPKKSIFLNANIWETDSPTYFMYVKKDSGASTRIEVSKRISPTIGGVKFNLCVFEYDDVANNKLMFQRFNSRYYGETATLSGDASAYKILSSGTNNWTYGTGVALYQDEKDNNHYVANHVALTANQELKVSDSTNWYTNATAGNHYTINNGNVKISTAGTYTLDFYLRADNSNHIVLTDENDFDDYVWNYTAWENNGSSTETNYYCVESWTNGASPDTNVLEVYSGSLRFKP